MTQKSLAANVPMIEPQKAKAAPKAHKPKDVMPAIQKEAGHGGKKKPSEIIRDYMLAQTGDQKMVDAAFQMIYQQVQQHTGRLIQFGNTVFWATQKGPGVLDVHIFTEEQPKLLVKRIQQSYQWAKAHGFKKITATLTDEDIIRILKMSGLPYSLSKTMTNDGKKMVPAYLMTMEVK